MQQVGLCLCLLPEQEWEGGPTSSNSQIFSNKLSGEESHDLPWLGMTKLFCKCPGSRNGRVPHLGTELDRNCTLPVPQTVPPHLVCK